MRTTLTIAAIAVLSALVPTAAQAATECQGSPSFGLGSSLSDAWDTWHDNVVSSFGSAWANQGMAQGVSSGYITSPLGDVTTYTVLATPCRVTRVNSVLLENVGDLPMMDSNSMGPSDKEPSKPSNTFKMNKRLAVFN